MAQILIHNSNNILTDLLLDNFKNYLDNEIFTKDTYEDIINLFYLLPNIDIVITKNDMGGDHKVSEFLTFLEKKELSTQVIVLGSCDKAVSDNPRVHHVQNELEWNVTIEISAKILKQELKELVDSKAEYEDISLKTFLNLGTIPVDTFIRIGKDINSYQYVKRIHAGDEFTKEIIQKYIDDGLEYFYIKKEDEQTFNNFLSNKFVTKLESIPAQPVENKLNAISEGFDHALNEVLERGFDSATIQMTETLISSMEQVLEANTKMTPLLHKVINSKSSYIYKHSHMSSIVSNHCLKNLIKYNEADLIKLTYASIFQNVALLENDYLAKVTNKYEMGALSLNSEDNDLVTHHAYESALILKSYKGLPEGVIEIVREHHGSVKGVNVEESDYEEMTELSKVFMISTEFAKLLLDVKAKKIKSTEIMSILNRRFNDPIILPYMRALENSLQGKQKTNE